MPKQTIIINGNHFSDLEEFHSEIEKVLTKDLNWRTGRGFDAFNDLLRGGFGVYEYEEPVIITWTHFSKSKSELGDEIMETLVDIIKDHSHIEFNIVE